MTLLSKSWAALLMMCLLFLAGCGAEERAVAKPEPAAGVSDTEVVIGSSLALKQGSFSMGDGFKLRRI